MQLGRSMIPVSRLIRRSCLEPTLWIWRKRVGVEPTIHPAKGRIAGFEDREDHRTPCASVYMKPTLDAGSYHGAQHATAVPAQRGMLQLQPRVDFAWGRLKDRKRLIWLSIFCGVSTSGRAGIRWSAA